MSDVLVKVENVSKKFCRDLKKSLWYGVKDITSELTGRGRPRDELRSGEFWSVNKVSFELKRGECLGLIGPNGAGKSTLLKMLNGLIKPDKGRIAIRGRIGALIELGAGFNPILTGRENIYVNGAVLGFTKGEISRKFYDIIDFSEVGDFIDTPVQNYSSGMKIRLGFAIAAQLEPDILLVDEVLAVGDAGFRAKCYNAIAKIAEGTCIILVSHSLPDISRMCSNVLTLHRGTVEYIGGDVPKGIAIYSTITSINPKTEGGEGSVKIEAVKLSSPSNSSYSHGDANSKVTIKHGEGLEVQMTILAKRDIHNCLIIFAFTDVESRGIAECYSHKSNYRVEIMAGPSIVGLRLDDINFNAGTYFVSVYFFEKTLDDRPGVNCGFAKNLGQVDIVDSFVGYAPIQLRGKWDFSATKG